MGWYGNYKALKDNSCKTGPELKKKNPAAWRQANKFNVPADLYRAWWIAEQKIKAEEEEQNLPEGGRK